jgi:uncharacterized protein (DUF1330 family)
MIIRGVPSDGGGDMAAYFVLMQQVDDIDRYRDEYIPQVRPLLKKHGAEVLVTGFEAEAAEGDPPNSTVVIRFPDAETAREFLDDPGYQPVKDIRYGITSRGQAVIAPEFRPAG